VKEILWLLVLILFVSGCTDDTVVEQVQPIQPVCNPPYILVGTGCCLDRDSNFICDSDEESIEIPEDEIEQDEEDIVEEDEENQVTTRQETIDPLDPVVQSAEPYISKIVFSSSDLRSKASSIVRNCPSGDKECQVNKIYRNIVDNYDYYSDPRATELIQTPFETMKIKGGDCEDLTILLNSLLENLGIKTYLVLTDTHAYSLVCGLDSDDLSIYVVESFLSYVSEYYSEESEEYTVIADSGNLIGFFEKSESFVLEGGHRIYYSAGDSKAAGSSPKLDIEYSIQSTQPINLYVLASQDDFTLYGEGQTFNHYSDCKLDNVLKVSGSCTNLGEYGGLMIVNTKYSEDVNIDLYRKYSYTIPGYELFNEVDMPMTYYMIDSQKCIVLDSTLGKDGYPGYAANIQGQKVAIDSVTREHVNLG